MTHETMSLRPITLPDLGSGAQSVRVSTWLTQIGEEVVAGDPIVEVLLPGISFDVEAPVSGLLRRIDCFENEHVTVGNALGWIEVDSSLASGELNS